MVKLEAFKPFTTHEMAKETLKTLASGELSPFISDFIETYFPSGKGKCFLSVQDNRMAAAMQSNLGITCKMNDAIFELYRGIRNHFDLYLKQNEGTETLELTKACLGLGHAVSRDSIQFDVNRQDKGIINSYCLIEQMEKNLNTFAMRIKEWYGWHFPELAKIVTDNYQYAQLAQSLGDKAKLNESADLERITEIVGDEDVAKNVIKAARMSMGRDISGVDLANIKMFSQRVVN